MDYARLEHARREVQAHLDLQKNPEERNRMGQFPTPGPLASAVVEHSLQLLAAPAEIRYLEPAFGTGSFYSALLRLAGERTIRSAVGIEIDTEHAGQASRLWRGTPLELRVGDFTREAPVPQAPNLLVCNPPYVRHHHLSVEEKGRLRGSVLTVVGRKPSGLMGLYGYFMLLAHRWMAPGCIAAWLVPTEFMDVNYGAILREYLTSRVTLLRMHRFNPEDGQFDGALVSSCVLWFANRPAPQDHVVRYTYGGSVQNPRESSSVALATLRESGKWTQLAHGPRPAKRDGTARLLDFFEVRRGLATGNNSFFILDEEALATREIPARFVTPVLPSSRFLESDEVLADASGEPIVSPRRYLLSCDLPEWQLAENYPSLWRYYQEGKDRGVDRTYLCSRRKPWYSQEHRPPPPFLCTYMARGRGSRVFRFIWNRSRATATNVYLLLYPRHEVAEQLRHVDLQRRVWEALNRLAATSLVQEGRVYGGGLRKLEPRELAHAPADEVRSILRESGSVPQGELWG